MAVTLNIDEKTAPSQTLGQSLREARPRQIMPQFGVANEGTDMGCTYLSSQVRQPNGPLMVI